MLRQARQHHEADDCGVRHMGGSALKEGAPGPAAGKTITKPLAGASAQGELGFLRAVGKVKGCPGAALLRSDTWVF